MTHLDLRDPSLFTPKYAYQQLGKRLFDLFLAVLLLPLIAVILAVIYGLSGPNRRAFFFAHARVGRRGQVFRCWKIRTMVPDAEARLATYLRDNPEAADEWRRTQKLNNDPRVTRLGRILRRSSLDELPQIWNVLRGEMSFVGPRPVTRSELDRYGNTREAYLELRPGITGYWQVHGRSNGCYEERLRMDQHYADHISLGRDLLLLAATVTVLVWPTGR